MMLFDSINTVKNIFHSMLDIVISFPFVKAIFQKKKNQKMSTETNIHTENETTKWNYIYLKEREKRTRTTINKYKYKAIAINDLNVNKYTKHLSAIVKSHKITWITWVKHSQYLFDKMKDCQTWTRRLFFFHFILSYPFDDNIIARRDFTWSLGLLRLFSTFPSNKYIFKFGCNGF